MTESSSDLLKRAEEGDPVALCRAMVAVPSVNPLLEVGGAGERILAEMCGGWLAGWGYQVELSEVEPGRWNLVARSGGPSHGPRLILNGHLDTVGVEGMAHDPFEGALREGRVWGRGACDMKGGLGIILAAAAEYMGSRRSDHPRPGELVVAFTADEEHASVGMERFVAEGLKADGAVVCEPTSLTVMPAHKGFLWVEARFKGKAAHGSRPDEGIDAILHAGQFLARLAGLENRLANSPPHTLLGRPSLHAGTIRGGTAPSVYPQECEVVLERRTLPGEDEKSVFQEFHAVLEELEQEIPELEAHLRPGLFRPGTEVAEESILVRTLLDSMEEEGVPGAVRGMTAWVDAAFLNGAGIPAVCFGPGSIAQAHSAEEWVSIPELETGARILSRFVRGFLNG